MYKEKKRKKLLFVLIDRILRKNSSKPSDGISAVNALLTQIDQWSKYTNVLVLAVSNNIGNPNGINLAFYSECEAN